MGKSRRVRELKKGHPQKSIKKQEYSFALKTNNETNKYFDI